MAHGRKLLTSTILLLLLLQFCTAGDTIISTQSLKDSDLLISANQTFALGFFNPANSTNRYLGIWYNKISEQTVVWVANRDNPINDTSGVLSFDGAGNLVVLRPNRNFPVWSSNTSALLDPAGETNRSAQLLDSGNLVVFSGGGNGKGIVVDWQSFDHPTNTWLPNMKFGVDRRTGLNRFITSWKSVDDPGTGEYSTRMDLTGSPPQVFLYKGAVGVWRTVAWKSSNTSTYIFNVSCVDDPDEVYVVYTMRDASVLSRIVVSETGTLECLTWHGDDRRWSPFLSTPKDECDNYAHCGANGLCNTNLNPARFECTCLPGFEPKSTRDWYLWDGSGGCVRERGGDVCGNREGFVKVARVKVPNTWTAHLDKKMGLKECKERCLRNCTCNGFASADISQGESGIGCVAWYGELVDTREIPSGAMSNWGQDLFVRVDAVELAKYSKTQHSYGNRRMVAAIVTPIVAVLPFIICLLWWFVLRKKKVERRHHTLLFRTETSMSLDTSMGNQFDESARNPELPVFDLSTIVAATDNFSFANKLGQGGFGIVYKGRLFNGEEIAVKRLGKNSGQGLEEFKTEVILIAKLQHRNLVRLLGYCIQQEEKMLIYEYLPNKGLDSFIFDKTKSSFLDWRNRFNIIVGIARGLLYLHQDSRLRIIHRDLKASNVLLDAAMNPKISDFGMAKMFGGDQIEANTNRVVGTYGYMSPEYAMEGLCSIKSDVFSFGVLVLEIVSGRRNSSYFQEKSMNLIGHVWSLWKEGQTLDMVDSTVGDSYPAPEVLRCIHIGLLCVQEFATDRPSMSDVGHMLCNETAALPSPKQPAFIFRRPTGADSSSTSTGGTSTLGNDVTITTMQAR